MIKVTPAIAIDESEIKEEFIRASGPGGQNVNKVATAVQLRFDVRNSLSLSEEVSQRLAVLAGGRMTNEGVLVVDARRFRTQAANRQDGLRRLLELIRRAAEKSRPRHETQPTLASKKRRLETKRRRSLTKRLRSAVADE